VASAAGAPSPKTQNLSLVVIAPDFSINNTSGAQTVNAGATANYTLSATPVGASAFANNVIYSCSGLPALSTCLFSPEQIAAGSGSTIVTLTLTTTALRSEHLPGIILLRSTQSLDQSATAYSHR
jgi:hypothetical protein